MSLAVFGGAAKTPVTALTENKPSQVSKNKKGLYNVYSSH